MKNLYQRMIKSGKGLVAAAGLATLLGGCDPGAVLPQKTYTNPPQTQASPPAKYEIVSSRIDGQFLADVRVDGRKMIGVAYNNHSVNSRGGDEFRLMGQGGEIIRIAGNDREGAVWFQNRNHPFGEFIRAEGKNAECPWVIRTYTHPDVSCAKAIELGREASRIYDGLAPLLAAELEKTASQRRVAARQDSDLERL